MRVLFISRWFPYPPDNGSRIRVFNLIKALSGRHQVTLLSFAQGSIRDGRIREMEAYCDTVLTVPYRDYRPTRLKALLGFCSCRPRSVVDTYSPEMEALVRRVDRRKAFDVVVVSQRDTALYALLLEGTPRVFDEVELAVIYEQFTRQHSLALRARYGLTWRKLSRFLRQLLREFQGCTVVSEAERELVLRVTPGSTELAVVPNGVDLETNSGDFGTAEPDTLVYTGALTYSANFDAMEFFLRHVFPRVQAQRPGVKLRITGGYEGVPVGQLPLGDGVELTGYLEDVRPVVAQSWACVVPLRVGGGTRLKILEAMALGTPVVSTSKGAEGLAVTHGADILVADEPEEFAGAVLRVLKDGSLRADLAARGRRLVEERYGWDRIGEGLERFLCHVVESNMGRGGR